MMVVKPMRWSLLIAATLLSVCFLVLNISKAKKHSTGERVYSKASKPHEEFKAELGRAAWTFLHTLGSKMPQHPDLEEKERYLTFIIEFSKLYPCKECRRDFQRILAKYPPQQSVQENAQYLREYRIKTSRSFQNKSTERLAEIDAKSLGVDLSRIKHLDYSIQDYEEWSLVSEDAAARQNLPDFQSKAWNSYKSDISSIGRNVDPSSNKRAALQNLMAATDNKRRRQSKRPKFEEEQDITFINVRNMKFNQKLERAYHIYCSNIQESKDL